MFALLLPIAAAQSWDAGADFSSTDNPNEVWTFGWAADVAGSVTPTTAATFVGLPQWSKAGTSWPMAVYNDSTAAVTLSDGLSIDPGHLYLHPSTNYDLSVLRFEAPEAACYQIDVSLELVDVDDGDVAVDVWGAGAELASLDMVAAGATSEHSVESLFLVAGDTVDLFVGPNATPADDTVDVEFAVLLAVDGVDTNGDGVPDDCPEDSDGDGVVDPLDLCEGDDATGDSDDDGVCDDLDLCEGGDASGDSDDDGVCDDLDLCDGDDATGDSDDDGVCDDLDLCEGDDASGDSDDDAVCDDLDLCEGDDATGDSDDDGVCDDEDLCNGDDALGDPDGDGECGDAEAPVDTGDSGDGDTEVEEPSGDPGCEEGCASSGGAPGLLGLMLLGLGLVGRRR